MPEEKEVVENIASEEDAKIIQDEIFNASRGGGTSTDTGKKPAEEKPAETEEKPAVETEEKPPVVETPKLTETEVQAGILEKEITDLTQDPKKLAKRFLDQKSFVDRQADEIGRLRQAERELLELKTQKQVREKVETQLNPDLVDLANTDPDKFNEVVVTKNQLGEIIQSQVNHAIGEIQSAEQLEREMAAVYPEYEERKPKIAALAATIPTKNNPNPVNPFTPTEILYLASVGYDYEKGKVQIMADAVKIARAELEKEYVEKEKGVMDKGRVTSTGSKPEATDSEILKETMLSLRR